MSDLSTFAGFAQALADTARAEALRWTECDWAVEDKSGGSAFDPVTRADRAVEQAMRAMIGEHWPDHGIAGEEFGITTGAGRYSWSLDPIDGTRSFICGLPSWTILIALLDEGQPVLGVIDAPRLDERFIGHGEVAELVTGAGRRPLNTSRCRTLAEARLSTTDPYIFTPADRERFERVRRETRLSRYGLDGYAYGRLAAGGLDLIVEAGLASHDMHALVPVLRAAGGAVGNWEGGSDFSDGHLVAAASSELFDIAVALLCGSPTCKK